MVDPRILRRHRRRSHLVSGGIVVLTAALLIAMAGAFLGGVGVALGALLVVGLAINTPEISWRSLVGVQGAQPLAAWQAPQLHGAVDLLAQRAGLPTPRILYMPSATPQAMAAGTPQDGAIIVTAGLLRYLPMREVIAVIAHEVAHLRNADLRVLNLAETLRALIGRMALLGWLALPLLFFGAPLPWLGVLLMIAAPPIATLLRFALSRTREFDADSSAVELTGDPEGLARALAQVEAWSRPPWWARWWGPQRSAEVPEALRSHPATEARIARLMALRARQL